MYIYWCVKYEYIYIYIYTGPSHQALEMDFLVLLGYRLQYGWLNVSLFRRTECHSFMVQSKLHLHDSHVESMWFKPSCQDVITHECAPRFGIDVITKHLPGYTLHELSQDKNPAKHANLSQHMFGWPAHRPRRYSVLTRDGRCELQNGVNNLKHLFRKPCVSVEAFFSAPEAGCNAQQLIHQHILDVTGTCVEREEDYFQQTMFAVHITLCRPASWYLACCKRNLYEFVVIKPRHIH